MLLTLLKALIPYYGDPARFRLCQYLHELFRKHRMKFLATCLKHYMLRHYGCEISINAQISTRTSFMHTTGVVIGEGVIIDDNVVVMGNVCLGRKKSRGGDVDYPHICSGVTLCNGCTVIGNIVVGKGTTIGANATLLCSTGEDEVWCGSPAVKVK